MDLPDFDDEGRLITLEFELFFLVVVYTPNSGAKLDWLKPRTEIWENKFREHLLKLKEKKGVVVMGDLNVAHKEIDVANPKSCVNIAGFTDEERACFTKLLSCGFKDTFRE